MSSVHRSMRVLVLSAVLLVTDLSAEGIDKSAAEQCAVELDECRNIVQERFGDEGGIDPADFLALTWAATDAASASAADSIRKSSPGRLVTDYKDNGQVTLRNVWPRSVTRLALQELEEIWQHYRLPATFHGTAFIRAETDNERIDGNMEFPPFDRIYSVEERSPALRRLITSSGTRSFVIGDSFLLII